MQKYKHHKELETLINKDIAKKKERLFKLYERNLITYEELMKYLAKLEKSEMKEPPTIY